MERRAGHAHRLVETAAYRSLAVVRRRRPAVHRRSAHWRRCGWRAASTVPSPSCGAAAQALGRGEAPRPPTPRSRRSGRWPTRSAPRPRELTKGEAERDDAAAQGAARPRGRGGGGSREGRVPGRPVARAAHAAQRRLRLGAHAAERPAPDDEAIGRARSDAIVRNADVQVQLIDDLLDVSRITTGKMRLDVAPRRSGAGAARRRSTRCGRPPRPRASGSQTELDAARGPGDRRPGAAPAGRLEPADERRQVHARRAARSSVALQRVGRARARSSSATPARASRRTCCRTSSSASARPTARARARTAGSGSAWRSSSTSSSCTAARSSPQSAGRGPRRDVHRDAARRAPAWSPRRVADAVRRRRPTTLPAAPRARRRARAGGRRRARRAGAGRGRSSSAPARRSALPVGGRRR